MRNSLWNTLAVCLKKNGKMRRINMILYKHPLMKKERNAVDYCLQGSHISRYNDLSKVMASAGDIYQGAKDANEETLASLQKDFSRGLITSTEILYKLNSLEARITDYVNS